MMKSITNISHHSDDYECMWNGIEDLYIKEAKEVLELTLFFSLASFGSFCYLKTEKAELKRRIVLGDGRTKKMYEFLAPIVGFEYKCFEYKTFEKLMVKAKAEIDKGHPVMLGALDMYYLSYLPKMYHKIHIPFHYFMMIGYDDDNQEIELYDCGRLKSQRLSYDDLRSALDFSYPGLSKSNTLFTVRITNPKPKMNIIKEAMNIRAKQFLNLPVSFVGYKGLDKFIEELPTLHEKLGKENFDKILRNFVQFLGTVPITPNKLLGINKPDEFLFYGGFDKISIVLSSAGNENGIDSWVKAAEEFNKACPLINEVKDIIVNYLVGEDNQLAMLPVIFKKVLGIYCTGFKYFI